MSTYIRNTLKVKTLSDITGVSESRLRSWEKKGLLIPTHTWKRSAGTGSLYVKSDIDLVKRIVAMREQKIGLNEIKRRLDLERCQSTE